MVKKVLIVLAILFLFSCNDDDSATCVNKGPLCSKHDKDYFSCKTYEYYNVGPYEHSEQVYVRIWYKVKDADDKWTVWNTYLEMYNQYCH